MSFKLLDDNLINEIAAAAQNSARRRSLYTFHQDNDDKIHRLLNVIQPDSYVRPHKHQSPDKVEVMVVLQGKLAMVEFAEDGRPASQIILTAKVSPYVLEIESNTWHMSIALEADTAVYIVTEGPWQPATHKIMAPWSPEEQDTVAAQKYLAGLRQELMLY
ncbi:WbuC family cupin fold metalloprotein [Patescibacteria group bacterium]|nr:WbuC family cupin fold metalloprotein [Patescibacteria group bacterium]